MFRIDVVDDLGLVSGRVDGDLTKEIARRYLKEVGKIANQHGLKRVLSDLREANLKVNEQEMLELSQELAQLGIVCSYKRAVVVKKDVNGYKLWENHCWNAGFKEIRLFIDNEIAVEWLAE